MKFSKEQRELRKLSRRLAAVIRLVEQLRAQNHAVGEVFIDVYENCRIVNVAVPESGGCELTFVASPKGLKLGFFAPSEEVYDEFMPHFEALSSCIVRMLPLHQRHRLSY